MFKLKITVFAMLLVLAATANAEKKWVDLTDEYISNPRFDNNSNQGWNLWSWTDRDNCSFGCQEFYNGYFEIYQYLMELAPGHYRLSVQGFYRTEGNAQSYRKYTAGQISDDEMCLLFVQTGVEDGYMVQPLANIYSAECEESRTGCWSPSGGKYYYPNTVSAANAFFEMGYYNNSIEFDADGDVAIGVYNYNYQSSNWCVLDNFKLEYEGEIVPATGLTLSIDTETLVVGQYIQVTPKLQPENVLIKRLDWTSSDEKVATVDRKGNIFAQAEGTTTITAKTTDGTNIEASITITVIHNKPTSESLVINEVMSSNVDQFISPAYNFDGWVELYNPQSIGVELSGLWLSDDSSNLRKWQLPANMDVLPGKGYALLWFDSSDLSPFNAPFKLDLDGGTVYVSDENGTLLASAVYPEGMERISYARTTDGGEVWGLTSVPTPGSTNNEATFATQQLPAPQVDQPSQIYNGKLNIKVTIPEGSKLRLTTDGSLPTLENGDWSNTGEFIIDGTINFRFRLFAEGKLASPVTTRSYIANTQDYSTLPIVSVVTNQDFLYDDYIGVYVQGVNGRPGNGQSQPCNWNMDWERPVNFSFIGTDGKMLFNQDVNLEMCGGWSRAWSPHSFKLKGSKELGGDKNLPYPFFEQKPFIRNRTLQIRNGGNDTDCRIKDPALQYIIGTSGLNIDYQSYQPVHEFINGWYVGVLNMREPNNKHYVYANYGWDDDEIDQFEISPDSNYVQKCGTPDAFEELVALSANAADPDTYKEICTHLLDIDAYINYMALELYLGSDDWPKNNIKGFRHRDGGKFRFVVFDLDHAFNSNSAFTDFMNKERWQFDQLYPTSLGRRYEQIKFVTLFKNMLNNADFRRKFIDAFCIMGGSVLQTDRANQIIDMLVARVDPAMSLRWESADQTANTMKSALRTRMNSSTSSMKQYRAFGLASTTAQTVKLESDTEGAQLFINDQQVPTGKFNGKLFPPVTLKAVAPAGYTFRGWLTAESKKETLINYGDQWSYYDQGSLDGTNWTALTYDVSAWKTGNAPLGYGKGDVKTTVDYGGNDADKRPTYYLRNTFTLPNEPLADSKFTLSYTIDDGCIIYVNGVEAGRYNMPATNISYSTFATSYAQSNPDMGTLSLKGSLFHKGENVVAIEVHNNSADSSDLYWDALLTMPSDNGESEIFSTKPSIALPTGTVTLIASFDPMTDSERLAQGFTPVRVNEVSASNDAFVNSYAKKGDWVELYNTTGQPIDLKGMFLSDDINNPEKYQITPLTSDISTIIAPHSMLIVWCDKLETTANELHAPFKLSADGGDVVLTAADHSWNDVLHYEAHDSRSTVGRYPDGCAKVYTMDVATIAKPNMLTSYVIRVPQFEGDDDAVRAIAVAPDGFRLRYGSDMLIVKGNADGDARLEVFTPDGRLVERTTVRVSGGTARIDVANLRAGCYVARATDSQGQTVSCKFLK